ncbi:hypothetical protein HMPREF1292_00792 [Corynebacterium sp. KPL1995]|nr:hypothetical protein HMPREF1292_00792 [Corynebacterium sp. KPL1995]ERS73505.1 hypothetical protein HMPREF1290_00795 [Corynebacterium sp. KPL1989]
MDSEEPPNVRVACSGDIDEVVRLMHDAAAWMSAKGTPAWDVARIDRTFAEVLLQLGAGAKKAPFLLCDQRYVPVLSGRLEYPANNHCIRIRVTIGKHRALPLPQ